MTNWNNSRNDSRDGAGGDNGLMVSIGFQVGSYCVIMLISLIGNLLVTITYKGGHNDLKNNVMWTTISHMAVADLMTTVTGIPYMISLLLCNQWLVSGTFGVAVCKLSSFIIEVGFAVSAQCIALIAIERFLSVFRPLKKTLDVKSAKIIGAMVWLCTCCFYTPRLYSASVYTQGNTMSCKGKGSKIKPWKEIEAVCYSILFLGTLALYIAIVVKVTCKKNIPGQAVSSQVSRSRTNRRVIRQGLGVITIHFLCWIPYLCIYVTCIVLRLKIVNVCLNLSMFHNFGIFFLGYSNAALNPILYTATNENFRKSCKTVIRSMCGVAIAPTAKLSVRNSTKREKVLANGDTPAENAGDCLNLNRPTNDLEMVVPQRRFGVEEKETDSPRIIVVSSNKR